MAAAALSALAPVRAEAAQGQGSLQTVILGPFSLVNTRSLNFGGIIPGGGGTVTVNPQTGARTATGVTLLGSTSSAATFIGSGTRNRVVTISIDPSPIIISNGAATMTINQLRVSVNGGGPQPVGPNANLGPTGVITYAVGGRLNVGANQAEGSYTGTFTLTMDYQ